VAPPWDIPQTIDAGLTIIVIEPSRGFGTGHHASTRLCLQALSHIELRAKRVLDLGTGSGVLALAAKLKGAHEVLALDVDPDAIEAARASAALNPLAAGVDFAVVDFRSASSRPQGRNHPPAALAWPEARHYDVVLANLTGGMLIQSSPRIVEFAAPDGLLVVSGFDESERGPVRNAFAALQDVASYVEDGWVGLVLRSAS
jgi:ribosomal protein L11 methyltransferase